MLYRSILWSTATFAILNELAFAMHNPIPPHFCFLLRLQPRRQRCRQNLRHRPDTFAPRRFSYGSAGANARPFLQELDGWVNVSVPKDEAPSVKEYIKQRGIVEQTFEGRFASLLRVDPRMCVRLVRPLSSGARERHPRVQLAAARRLSSKRDKLQF